MFKKLVKKVQAFFSNRDKIEKRDDVYYLSLTSNGWSLEKWTNFFRLNHFIRGRRVITGAFRKMMMQRFVSTNGKQYRIAIAGKEIFANRKMASRRDYGKELGWLEPPAEVIFLLRKKLTNKKMKKMGFSTIWVMTEPFEDNDTIIFSLWFDDPKHSLEREALACDWNIPSEKSSWGFAFLVPDEK